MHETVEIPLADLQLDPRNARLGEEQPSQQAIYLALANQQGKRLVKLAEDIVKNGLDPTALPAVVATNDRQRRYRVIEGNRRVLSLKSLETPTIVSYALGAGDQRKLLELAGKYAESPLDPVKCVLFDNEEEVRHWVELRHTGQNEGAGLVEWDANEKDRFMARHGKRNPAGQILDFLASESKDQGHPRGKGVLTNLQRLIATPAIRERLGIDVIDGHVVSNFPREEVVKGLARIVGDLRGEAIRVKDIYYEDDRKTYIDSFGNKDLPVKSKRLDQPVTLEDLRAGRNTPASVRPKKQVRRKQPVTVSIVPRACALNPTPPRINAIFNELAQLNVDLYPNACAVLLRVFLELSVDHEIERVGLIQEEQRRSSPLAKRLRMLTDHLVAKKRISDQLRRAMDKVAGAKDVIAASATTFNQYVHNPYVHPKPSELRTAWDELQPFFEKIWR